MEMLLPFVMMLAAKYVLETLIPVVVTPPADVQSPFILKSSKRITWIAPVVVVTVEPSITSSLTVVEPAIVTVPAFNAPVATKVEPTLLLSESTVAFSAPFWRFTLPTVVLEELLRVSATFELVATTLPRKRPPVAPLAVKMFVEPLLPPSRMPDGITEKSMGPLLAVTSTLDPSKSSLATLVNATLVWAVTSPLRNRLPICEN